MALDNHFDKQAARAEHERSARAQADSREVLDPLYATVEKVAADPLVPNSLLKGVRTVSVSGQIPIIAGSKGSLESFGFSEIPATVRLGL